MPRPKSPPWSTQENAVLHEIYPTQGLEGVTDLLPDRTWRAIYMQAYKLGLRTTNVARAPKLKIEGSTLDRAVQLREQGLSYARIGAELGFCEMTVSNAVIIAMCHKQGFTPAQRNDKGHLTAEGLDRLRLLLRKGLKAVDIQLRLGVSAACVAEQRRRYAADLKARGKAPLPPAGAGEAYSGRKITSAQRREIEALFLQGLGAQKVSQRTGISNTQVGRIRNRLVKRLARKGQCLPGCDSKGRRHVQAESTRFILPEQVERFRALIMDGEPVNRAASAVGIGGSSAYRLRNRIAAELAEQGGVLPPTRNWRDRRELRAAADARSWLPEGKILAFRKLAREIGVDAAKARIIDEAAAARRAKPVRPLTFEEQLERVRNGARIARVVIVKPAIADITLGGVATGML